MKTFKMVAGLITGMGVNTVVSGVLKTLRPADLKKIEGMLYTVGGVVLGSMVAASAGEYVGETIDEYHEEFTKLGAELNEQVK